MMNDHTVHMALRSYGLGVASIATTGLKTLTATTTGFTRADGGSFITDKFSRGLEIVTNFNAVRAVITSVSPTDMRVKPFIVAVSNGVQSVTYPALVASAGASGRSITAVIPSMRSLENDPPLGLSTFTPIAGIPYMEEEYSPDITTRVTGTLYASEGDFFWKIHGVIGMGSEHLRQILTVLKDYYTNAIITMSGENYVIRIRGDPAPVTRTIIQTLAGPVLVLAVPWEVRSRKA